MAAILLWGVLPGWAAALDQVSFRRDNKTVYVTGKVLTEAVDGGLLVQDREGVLWLVQPEELLKRATDEEPYQLFQGEQLQRRVLEQLPPGFQVRATAHYLVCYNTSPAYADWAGRLFEKLYLAFQNFWTRLGVELSKPAAPLVVVVFDRQEPYLQHARGELGEASANILAYYSLLSNRVTMYDLAATAGLPGTGGRGGTEAQIRMFIQQPNAKAMIATVIHEATHQIAYNAGLHARFADIPLWVSEGVAMFCETLDLKHSQGGLGGLNRFRLTRFQQNAKTRGSDALPTLLSEDARLRKPSTALDAYAEAWAFNYYLINRRPKQYVQYLQRLAEHEPMLYDKPEERLAEFRQIFGDDLAAIDAEFLRFMAAIR